MCGFTGFLDRSETTSPEQLTEIVGHMTASLHHRGPDDGGIWTDSVACVALGHRRLSILDLTSAGHQPMVSRSGRYVIAFNGEIYNHLALRHELDHGAPVPDHPLFDTPANLSHVTSAGWRGHSDTETLLAAIESWGIGETLRQCVGMFAFGLWDRQDKLLYLARDRLGEKPLYYGWQGNTLLFGSELKALRRHPAFRAEINRDALTLFFRHDYIPAPYTIYQDIHKLPPGSFIALGAHRNSSPTTYWTVQDAALRSKLQPYAGSENEATDQLEALLRQSLQGQMVADVPLGAFLSGGIDSTTVVALMQSQSARPVKTFTIGFREEEFDEAAHAAAIARHLGTEHTEWYVTPEEAMGVIPHLSGLYDEPFADVSQIPTHLVSRLARQQVAVSLSGDGGDELFGGYNRHVWTRKLWRQMRYCPAAMRSGLAGLLTIVPPHAWNSTFRLLGFMLPAGLRYASPGDKLHKISSLLRARRPEDIYLDLVSIWKEPARLVRNGHEPATLLTDPTRWPELRDLEHRMMYLDTLSYLPDDILVKVDRAAMGTSLETRVPFLDHRLVEFAWQLPLSMKIRDGQGKWLLRQLLYRLVPQDLVDRPKMGFSVPVDQWLRGPLKDWAEPLIEPARLKSEGYLNPALVTHKWRQHQSGRRNEARALWSVLMFQSWLASQ